MNNTVNRNNFFLFLYTLLIFLTNADIFFFFTVLLSYPILIIFLSFLRLIFFYKFSVRSRKSSALVIEFLDEFGVVG